MSEQYNNNAASTTTGTINNSSDPVTFSVQTGDGALFPATTNGSFEVTVANADGTNSETMLCTSRSTDSLTCSRGANATLEVPTPTLLTHASGSIVSHDFSTGAFNRARADLINSNTDANLPATAASRKGDLFLPTDGISLSRYDGSAFKYWGPIYPVKPPIAANFSWLNQSGTHFTGAEDSWSGGVTLSQTTDATGAVVITARAKNVLASKSFTFSTGFNLLGRNLSGHNGPFVSDGTQLILMGLQTNGPTQIRISLYSSVTAYAGDYYGPANIPNESGPWFFRIVEDATNRTFYMSSDLRNWWQVFQHAVTTGFTSTKYGYGVQSRSGGSDFNVLTMFHLTETNP